MATMGRTVQARAERLAPVYTGRYDRTRGSYRAAFATERKTVEVGTRFGNSRRAGAFVYNSDPAALFVEFGNRNTPRHDTLWRAIGEGA